MADTVGLSTKMSLYTVGAWDTAHPGGTGDQMAFVSETLTQTWQEIMKNALVGSGGREPSDQGNEIVAGNTIHELDYDNFDPFFEMFFGQVSTRTFEFTNDNVSKWYWNEFEKSVERWRFGASKMNTMKISGPNEGLVMLECGHHCRTLSRVATAFAATAPTVTGRVLFKQLTFRIADQVDALGSGDVVPIESFELNMSRNFKVDDYVGGSVYAVEPVPAEFREVTLNFSMPRYAANTIQGWKQANTKLQADITFAGGASGGIVISIPELRIPEGFDANIEGAGPLKQAGALRAFKNVYNTPMAAITDEVKIVFS